MLVDSKGHQVFIPKHKPGNMSQKHWDALRAPLREIEVLNHHQWKMFRVEERAHLKEAR